MRQKTRRARKSKKVGGQGPLPGSYFGLGAAPSAPAGGDLLPYRQGAGPVELGRLSGGPTQIRPAVGGFVPSIGEPFVAAASKYVVPLALFAGYKLMGRKGAKSRRKERSRKSRPSQRSNRG